MSSYRPSGRKCCTDGIRLLKSFENITRQIFKARKLKKKSLTIPKFSTTEKLGNSIFD